MKMTQSQIEKYAKNFLKQAYNLDLVVPIEVNSRLKTTLGRFRYTRTTKKPVKLEFSKNYIVNGKLEDIQGTIKHECIHYALFMLGKPFNDGQPLFESELVKHGSHSTRTVRLAIERNINLYKCKCGTHTTKRALRNNGRFHTCTKCKQNLVYLGKEKVVI